MISSGTPKAKAVCWDDPDTERRKRGEQKGLTFVEGVLSEFKSIGHKNPSGFFGLISRQKILLWQKPAFLPARFTFKLAAKRNSFFYSLRAVPVLNKFCFGKISSFGWIQPGNDLWWSAGYALNTSPTSVRVAQSEKLGYIGEYPEMDNPEGRRKLWIQL